MRFIAVSMLLRGRLDSVEKVESAEPERVERG